MWEVTLHKGDSFIAEVLLATSISLYRYCSYTNVADSQVPNGVADVTSGGPIQEQQPVDQGKCYDIGN